MSVEKKPNGGYLARWRDESGKQRARTFERKVDATKFLAAVKVDTERGTYVDHTSGRETVLQYASAWAAAQPWRPQTRERNEHVIRSQIAPHFGALQLRRVSPSAVQAWVGHMTAAGLAPSTVEGYYRVLAAVMLAAKRDRLIAESPTDGVRLPRAEHSAAALVPLSVEQVRALSDAVPGRYRATLTFAGQSQTSEFEIQADPRLRTTPEEYRAQFTAALAISDELSAVHARVGKLLALEKALVALAPRVNGQPALVSAVEALELRRAAATEALYQPRLRSEQDPLNFPVRLNNKLSTLLADISAGNNPPTDAQLALSDELLARARLAIADADAVLDGGVGGLNDRLAEAGVAVLALPEP